MKVGEQVQFACGLEHTWIDGKFTHIRRDGLLQIVSNDHYYHPERADYAYQPPEPASRAEEPHLWAECVAEMPETGGPCGYKPGDYVHKPGAYRYHAFRGAPTSETLSEAQREQRTYPPLVPGWHWKYQTEKFGEVRDWVSDDLEAAIAAEARRPLEERVTELEAWQQVAVTSNKEIAALTESDHGWLPAAVLALKNRAERAEAALRERDEERRPLLDALEQAESALRENITTWITLEPALGSPYPDDQRWTPWTRFGERAFRAAGRAQDAVRRALASGGESEDGNA